MLGVFVALATSVPSSAQAVCGDSVLDGGEQCDDGNTNPGDCCSDTCMFEAAASACDDGDACTQTDTCDGAGTCTGANPVVCTASDQCHDAGTCDPATGVCSDPAKADGTACDDADACTQTDTCQAGTCTGANPVVCTASDQCHDAGTCDPATGVCSDPVTADGTACDDGSISTTDDQCVAGGCVGTPIWCGDGVLSPELGEVCDHGADNGVDQCCSSTCELVDSDADGTCNRDDACANDAANDADGDGVCDDIDNCGDLANTDQADTDGDGDGDVCDPVDGEIEVTRVRVRPLKKQPPSNLRSFLGLAKVAGIVTVEGDPLDFRDGLLVQVADALSLDESYLFGASECRPPSRRGRIVCKSEGGDVHARFVETKRGSGRYRFRVRMRGITMHTAYAGPAMVILTDVAAVDRIGVVESCTATAARLSCKGESRSRP